MMPLKSLCAWWPTRATRIYLAFSVESLESGGPTERHRSLSFQTDFMLLAQAHYPFVGSITEKLEAPWGVV